MTRQRKSAPERRAEIVGVALALAAEVGLQGTTAEAIAGRIGLTQPAIFRHFPRKDDMWGAVIDWLEQQLRARWGEAMQSVPAGRRVAAIVSAHLAFVSQFPAMPLVLLSPELRRSCAAIAEGSQRLIGQLHGALARAVEDGREAGAFAASAPAEDVAHMLLALMQGTALRWAVSGHRFDLVGEGLRLAELALDGVRGGR